MASKGAANRLAWADFESEEGSEANALADGSKPAVCDGAAKVVDRDAKNARRKAATAAKAAAAAATRQANRELSR